MMKWIFIDTGENPGQFNMDFDLKLCTLVSTTKKPILRFYKWKPYAISLGYHQKLDSINTDLAKQNNIDIVIRPTGGRSILHSEELTYSVVFPLEAVSPHNLYQLISDSIVKGLHLYDRKLRKINLEKSQIDFKEFYKSSRSIPCFSSTAKNEIKFQNKKLVGSAQRVLASSILQHGSILCGNYHKNLVHYLKLSNEEKQLLKKDLDEKTISLFEILNEEIDYSKLKKCIRRGFESTFGAEFLEPNLEVTNEFI